MRGKPPCGSMLYHLVLLTGLCATVTPAVRLSEPLDEDDTEDAARPCDVDGAGVALASAHSIDLERPQVEAADVPPVLGSVLLEEEQRLAARSHRQGKGKKKAHGSLEQLDGDSSQRKHKDGAGAVKVQQDADAASRASDLENAKLQDDYELLPDIETALAQAEDLLRKAQPPQQPQSTPVQGSILEQADNYAPPIPMDASGQLSLAGSLDVLADDDDDDDDDDCDDDDEDDDEVVVERPEDGYLVARARIDEAQARVDTPCQRDLEDLRLTPCRKRRSGKRSRRPRKTRERNTIAEDLRELVLVKSAREGRKGSRDDDEAEFDNEEEDRYDADDQEEDDRRRDDDDDGGPEGRGASDPRDRHRWSAMSGLEEEDRSRQQHRQPVRRTLPEHGNSAAQGATHGNGGHMQHGSHGVVPAPPPTPFPTEVPTPFPTETPTPNPTPVPTARPTPLPTTSPTSEPTTAPPAPNPTTITSTTSQCGGGCNSGCSSGCGSGCSSGCGSPCASPCAMKCPHCGGTPCGGGGDTAGTLGAAGSALGSIGSALGALGMGGAFGIGSGTNSPASAAAAAAIAAAKDGPAAAAAAAAAAASAAATAQDYDGDYDYAGPISSRPGDAGYPGPGGFSGFGGRTAAEKKMRMKDVARQALDALKKTQDRLFVAEMEAQKLRAKDQATFKAKLADIEASEEARAELEEEKKVKCRMASKQAAEADRLKAARERAEAEELSKIQADARKEVTDKALVLQQARAEARAELAAQAKKLACTTESAKNAERARAAQANMVDAHATAVGKEEALMDALSRLQSQVERQKSKERALAEAHGEAEAMKGFKQVEMARAGEVAASAADAFEQGRQAAKRRYGMQQAATQMAEAQAQRRPPPSDREELKRMLLDEIARQKKSPAGCGACSTAAQQAAPQQADAAQQADAVRQGAQQLAQKAADKLAASGPVTPDGAASQLPNGQAVGDAMRADGLSADPVAPDQAARLARPSPPQLPPDQRAARQLPPDQRPNRSPPDQLRPDQRMSRQLPPAQLRSDQPPQDNLFPEQLPPDQQASRSSSAQQSTSSGSSSSSSSSQSRQLKLSGLAQTTGRVAGPKAAGSADPKIPESHSAKAVLDALMLS
eukprot:TRINITY_DN7088_c3_g1_i1.p1 TRINITY_DN7088_c3_g1~~TRINITY_DN7088_c3_g1_i1.p1  ORF type:complete len:1119 (+),score=292.63 TRINITY_DN7088_c3_g1_i1:50-3406(+)